MHAVRVFHEIRRAEQQPVDDAEHRRIRPDAEAEGRHYRDREAWPRTQAADGVLEVLDDCLESHGRWTPPGRPELTARLFPFPGPVANAFPGSNRLGPSPHANEILVASGRPEESVPFRCELDDAPVARRVVQQVDRAVGTLPNIPHLDSRRLILE